MKQQNEDGYRSQISEKTIVGAMNVGAMIVGAVIVGAMIVRAMIVGALIVGAMIVGAMIVGVMRLSQIYLMFLYKQAMSDTDNNDEDVQVYYLQYHDQTDGLKWYQLFEAR